MFFNIFNIFYLYLLISAAISSSSSSMQNAGSPLGTSPLASLSETLCSQRKISDQAQATSSQRKVSAISGGNFLNYEGIL